MDDDLNGLRNTPEFGAAMKCLRENVERQITAFAQAGGPDRAYINKIESGEDMAITAHTLYKYKTAILAKDRSQQLDTSFLSSLAMVFKAEQTGEEKPQRDATLLKMRQPDSLLSSSLIGIDLTTGDPVRADYVREPRSRTSDGSPASAWVLQQHFGGDKLAIALGRIAKSRPAVTLLSHKYVDAMGPLFAIARDWHHTGGKRLHFGLTREPKAIVDPIAGVRDLGAAIRRAEVLGASGSKAVIAGWAILGANAKAQAAFADLSPIQVWGAVRDARSLASFVQPPGEGLTAPLPEELYAVGNEVIRKWAIEYTAAAWKITYSVGNIQDQYTVENESGPVIMSVPQSAAREMTSNPLTWRSEKVEDVSEYALAAGDLCVYDEKQYHRLGHVLADMGLPAQLLTETSLEAVTSYPPRGYELIAISPHYSYGLAREIGGEQWRPIQMFPSYDAQRRARQEHARFVARHLADK